MTSTKVLILDFDNCVALDERTGKGSEEIKDEAWFPVFPEYERGALHVVLEESKKKVVGGKGDRADIAKDVLIHFGFTGADIADEVIKRCTRFNEVIQEGIKNISLSQGWKEALAELQKRIPLYLNTATPRETVLESLHALGVASFFKAVYGRPGTKVENINKICAAEGVLPQKILFVDDQMGGWEAAKETNVQFVGMHTARNTLWHNTPQPFPIIHSLKELVPMLAR
ncbi:hypothetical protein A3D66_02185 [Candidatus Kaiserbacteria bacterium RIFCSPHIGHO2_02_FULL_50_9]|uniref:HAD family hydrolase n=1 Tax=Candidatus Kaiserbacteria bacterium RIFCSPLOWO2_01_FULL_51_21 TaxID=1798508 RepID=A0A1F6EEB1_9BACT|nr:MAG: hypothetical protein A2761_03440 [Candidatus Kaiserbacteria bacterium RIFCSPHIGHO2_01_FULL_51_33]OGG63412.1 MAG: hypothetical protein A3D66_02185 [Candidatus Kaiserbacteria bacterium RIFCSPHIGHO2_02_FULL_50_9]OGG72004.1 MAG: hypothetical protein A3A35_01270 [Candidatus Kaiserbacteria bacterium RIFCSPLOWO2_01_FULL_51_21]